MSSVLKLLNSNPHNLFILVSYFSFILPFGGGSVVTIKGVGELVRVM